MNLLDAVVLAAIAVAGLGGFRAGFLARVASWIGLGLGFYLALRLIPTVFAAVELPTATGRLLVVITVLIAGTFIGQAVGLVIGHRVRGALPPGGLRTADRVIGSLGGVVSVLVALWIMLPTLADITGWPARQARNSLVAKAVNSSLPKPPDTTQSVRRLIDDGNFPRVFESLTPAPDAGRAPVGSELDPQVQARVAASTVKVVGEACERIQEGSGFVVANDMIVTNAHVVAGDEGIEVTRPDGKRLAAEVVVFDPKRDLALLRVDRLALAPLERGTVEVGATGAVFGHPGGQAAVRAAPARISDEVVADGKDIYNDQTTRRQVFILAADLASGDSGGALVDNTGKVVGVAFAIAPDRPGTAYALTGVELDRVVRQSTRNPNARADTGECLAG